MLSRRCHHHHLNQFCEIKISFQAYVMRWRENENLFSLATWQG